MYEVHSPIGMETIKRGTLAANLGQLDGKTIAESWNGDFKGDYTFPLIRELLQKRFPRLRIIPYDELPYFHGADSPLRQRELARNIATRARELGCDALISGNGA